MSKAVRGSAIGLGLAAAVALLGLGTAAAQDGNGSIVAWGWNDYGQCNVPTPNTNFVALAAG